MLVAMRLHYLDFDFSDEASGHGSFDAMASVRPERLAALCAEIAAVLRWAHGSFGPPGAPEGEGEWDFELQAVAEPDTPLQAAYVQGTGELALSPAPAGTERTTLSLTVGGSPAFCEALRTAFELD